jgi:hypothetical protein
VKKMNYYAVQNPWRLPKWLGAILGCAFGVIAIGSAVAIVQLTRPPAPPVAAVAPTPAPVVHAALAPTPAATVTTPVASASDDAAPVVSKKHASKRHAAHGKKGGIRLASAKHSAPSMMDSGKRATILAKHDSKEKRQQKDALDKLLGL